MELTREQVKVECEWLVSEHCSTAGRKWLAHDAALRLRCEEAERMQARWKVLASMTKECACVWGINETPDDQYCGGEHNDTIEQLCLAHQKMFDKQLADLTEKLAEMTEELENYRSIAEREGATIAVSELVVLKTQLQAMTKERDEYEAYSHLANRTLDDVTAPLKQQLATAQAENVRLRKAAMWALGYTDFRPRNEGDGVYYWRRELRERAFPLGVPAEALTPQEPT